MIRKEEPPKQVNPAVNKGSVEPKNVPKNIPKSSNSIT